MVLEVGQGLLSPQAGLVKVKGKSILVGVDGIVPYEEADSEDHGGVEVLPVGRGPPQAGEQSKVTLLEPVALLCVWNSPVPNFCQPH